ncbi:MAG: hypothetical protein ACE5HO_04225 [bacterium]
MVTFVLILALGAVAELFFPWWSVVVVAFSIGGWKGTSGWRAFSAGFLAIGGLWLIVAGFIHFQTGGILTERVSTLLKLPTPLLLPGLAALLGGLVSGLAAASGYHLRKTFKAKQF